VEFVFIFAIVFRKVFLINLFEVVEIIGAFGIDALMDDKVFAFFLWDECIATVWAAQFHGGETAFIWGEPGGADLAEKLAFGTVILVKERFWRVTARASAVIRNITFRASADRADLFAIAFFVIRDEFRISPVLSEVGNKWEFINFKLLIFWGMGIIRHPLLKRDVSADKI